MDFLYLTNQNLKCIATECPIKKKPFYIIPHLPHLLQKLGVPLYFTQKRFLKAHFQTFLMVIILTEI